MKFFRYILAFLGRLIEHLLSEVPIPVTPPALPAPAETIHVTHDPEPRPAPPPGSPEHPGPLFIIDVSHWNGPVNWGALWRDPRYVGVWIKATQGTRYPYVDYFRTEFERARRAAAEVGRLGTTAWIGAYHYLNFDQDGARQADYHWSVTAPLRALSTGVLVPLLDVERGGPEGSNYDDAGDKIAKCAHDFVTRWLALGGVAPALYGRGVMQERHVTGLLGCSSLANPAYTARMPGTDRIRISRADTSAWQYTNGATNLTSFPTRPPGGEKCDTSVVLDERPGIVGDLACVRRRLVWR